MKRLRDFYKWIMIDPKHPELARAQHRELQTKVPFLYALLVVNAVAVAYTHYDYAPKALTVWFLLPLLVACVFRSWAWIKARKSDVTDEQAIARLRQTVFFAAAMSLVFVLWALSLDSYGGPMERGHVALFIAITVIGCIFCVMYLPQAAVLVLATVSVPYLIYYITRNEAVYTAIALNILLVGLVVLQVLISNFAGFRKQVEAQAALTLKQKETERLSQENARLAHTDALTTLPNRRHFFARLEAHLKSAERIGGTFAVGVIDLDRFKPVNDTYGHQLGDQLLSMIGERLKSLSSPHMDIARLGGDEFGLIYTGDIDRACDVCQKACEAISEPVTIGDLQVNIGASCGLAIYPEAGRTAHELFDRSDYALFISKSSTRGRTTVYSAEHEERIRSDRAIESALQRADIATEFEVYFQPVVLLPERKVTAFEALARWTSPTLDKVGPDQFIPIAERTGLIHRLTPCLFDKAVSQLKQLPKHLYMSFNLSAHDISSADTIERLVSIVREHRVSASQITFEITETAVIGSFFAARAGMERLRAAGFRLALDDFGTGYSSLSYLHRLPIDFVKIDRSFVDGLTDPMGHGLVTSILNLCATMQIRCVVEGIETPEQLEVLEGLRCRLVQGYLFGRPMSFNELLAESKATDTVCGHPLITTADLEPRLSAVS